MFIHILLTKEVTQTSKEGNKLLYPLIALTVGILLSISYAVVVYVNGRKNSSLIVSREFLKDLLETCEPDSYIKASNSSSSIKMIDIEFTETQFYDLKETQKDLTSLTSRA